MGIIVELQSPHVSLVEALENLKQGKLYWPYKDGMIKELRQHCFGYMHIHAHSYTSRLHIHPHIRTYIYVVAYTHT